MALRGFVVKAAFSSRRQEPLEAVGGYDGSHRSSESLPLSCLILLKKGLPVSCPRRTRSDRDDPGKRALFSGRSVTPTMVHVWCINTAALLIFGGFTSRQLPARKTLGVRRTLKYHEAYYPRRRLGVCCIGSRKGSSEAKVTKNGFPTTVVDALPSLQTQWLFSAPKQNSNATRQQTNNARRTPADHGSLSKTRRDRCCCFSRDPKLNTQAQTTQRKTTNTCAAWRHISMPVCSP